MENATIRERTEKGCRPFPVRTLPRNVASSISIDLGASTERLSAQPTERLSAQPTERLSAQPTERLSAQLRRQVLPGGFADGADFELIDNPRDAFGRLG